MKKIKLSTLWYCDYYKNYIFNYLVLFFIDFAKFENIVIIAIVVRIIF